MKRFLKCIAAIILIVLVLLAILCIVTPEPPARPVLQPLPATGGVSAAVADGNRREILGDKNGELRIYPASTTKILTSIIALEEGKAKLNQNAVITDQAINQDGTKLGIRKDMPISLHEMLYGMMLVSGNDAAVATAETVGGSQARFVEMMNEKASHSIGVTHSHFANPSGLTNPDHYSTACDMALIASYAMQNPDFRDIVKRKSYPMKYRNGLIRVVENRNEFLGSGYPGANGVKTGMTEAAGECLVASSERDGQLIIVSVYNDKNRWNDVKALLDWGFAASAAENNWRRQMAAEPFLFKFANRLMGRETEGNA
jgi:D-alanyl-D-alanine carboxypeptidase (penicillin-binding protein 5/6)